MFCVYDMRQTNLKLDPRGPTELLLLSTVELIYKERIMESTLFKIIRYEIETLSIKFHRCQNMEFSVLRRYF